MKELIILSGASGIGKTTTFLPHLGNRGYKSIETGDLFKSMLGNIFSGSLASDTTFKQERVKDAFAENFEAGLKRYEQDWKPEIGDVQSCFAFEYIRMVEWDFHVKSVFVLADLWGHSKVVTSIINQNELELVLKAADKKGWHCTLIRLDCLNPSRSQANRRLVGPQPYMDSYTVSYQLEKESVDLALAKIDDILSGEVD